MTLSIMPPPISGEPGLLVGTQIIPTTPPLAYVPCKGELGFSDGKLFLPMEPFPFKAAGDFPLPQIELPIDREPPYLDQTGMNVATPCVAPYNWAVAAASRTMILDTTPDAIASAAEKAVPGYVPNPGLFLSSKTLADYVAYDTITAGAFVLGQTYEIVSIGSTNFTLIGAASNTVGVSFVASGVGAGTGTAKSRAYDSVNGVAFLWTYGATPAQPHPALRTGQTRYSGISGAAVGTAFAGVPFLPGSGAALINNSLRLCAYRYGLLLSTDISYPVKIKIGKAKATWSKAAQTLTLATTDTASTTIKYKLDGGGLTTYTVPIAITDSFSVEWYAEKTNMVTSDTWTTTGLYQDAMPPDDFETFYFSALPVYANTPIKVPVEFQRRPDWYISPTGTGDGLTAATPSNATTIIGLTTAAGSAQNTQLIWASEGTYTNPTGTASTYFSNTKTITIRGGYNSDFTERDVMTRKTIFTSTGWNDGTATADINDEVLSVTAGCIDGIWLDTGTVTRTDTDPSYPTSVTILSSLMGGLGTLYNCHIDTDKEYAGGANDTEISGGTSSSHLKAFYGACYNCSSNISVTVLPGADGADDAYTSAAIKRGGGGGGNKAEITIGASRLENCIGQITLNVGAGGKGGNASSISAEFSCYTLGGIGGNTFGTIWLPTIGVPGGNFDISVSCNVGAGGKGGTSGAATSTTTDGGYYDVPAQTAGGSGGSAQASCQSTNTIGDATVSGIVVSCVSGEGGSGGAAGDATTNAEYIYPVSGGGKGGFSASNVSIGVVKDAEVISGDGGAGGSAGTITYNFGGTSGPGIEGAGGYSAAGAVANLNSVLEPTTNIEATSGNGGIGIDDIYSDSSSRATVTIGDSNYYRVKLTGFAACGSCPATVNTPEPQTQSSLAWGTYPTYFEAGDITFTEGTPWGAGNPVRVNHAGGSTVGWWSGLDNGDGAPLAGYETPQGTGLALGDYWE